MKQPCILVVDDDIALCALLRATFELEGIDVLEAHHVVQAERLIVDKLPDAIVLDIGLPGIDGLFYCQRLRENPRTRNVPIVVISGSDDAGAQATAAGATSFVRKPFNPLELLTLLEVSIGVTPLGRAFAPGVSAEAANAHAAQLRRLIDVGRHRHETFAQTYRQTVAVLASSLENGGLESSAHAERVTAYAMRLAVEVAPSLIDDPSLEWGFLLHDVGNVGVPSPILRKPGPLTDDERKELQAHTTIGERLVAQIPLLGATAPQIVRSHHERWDGQGYPDGRGGSEIPPAARIFAVADALEAMTDRRVYRRPFPWETAVERIKAGTGTQFDADVVDGLSACEPDLRLIRERWLKPRRGGRAGGSGRLSAAVGASLAEGST